MDKTYRIYRKDFNIRNGVENMYYFEENKEIGAWKLIGRRSRNVNNEHSFCTLLLFQHIDDTNKFFLLGGDTNSVAWQGVKMQDDKIYHKHSFDELEFLITSNEIIYEFSNEYLSYYHCKSRINKNEKGENNKCV